MNLAQWCEDIRRIDADILSTDDCASLVPQLAQLSKACDAAKARLAAKAAAGYAHRREGFADAADWLAMASGTNSTDARRAIEAAEQMKNCPLTDQAWRTGQISAAQASEIAQTEAARPGSEAKLLPLAQEQPLRALREQARHERLTAADPAELRGKQHKARHLKRWQDDLGMTCISGAFVPELGAALLKRIDDEAEKHRRAA